MPKDTHGLVAPVRERGLKYDEALHDNFHHGVAPVRERGLKSYKNNPRRNDAAGRSREGAWIEILN